MSKENNDKKPKGKKKLKLSKPKISNRNRTILGLLCLFFGVVLTIAFLSYLFTWQQDQSHVFKYSGNYFTNKDAVASNSLGKLGAYLSHHFFYNWIGITSFLVPFFLFTTGYHLFAKRKLFGYRKSIFLSMLFIIIVSLLTSFFFQNTSFPWGGAFGKYTNSWIQSFIGRIGALLLYIVSIAGFILYYFDIDLFKKKDYKPESKEPKTTTSTEPIEEVVSPVVNLDEPEVINLKPEDEKIDKKEIFIPIPEEALEPELQPEMIPSKPKTQEDDFEIQVAKGDEDLDLEVNKIVEEKEVGSLETEYDPKLDLRDYQFPTLGMLASHGESNIEIDREELQRNKNQIVETLRNYKIEISKISATVGPTVTLYEIVPAPGVRISKIKNLEDDIALSLAALGIRIIAPIPGKGTIGIEVPNKHPNIVSMKSMLASEKFANSKAELPVAIGKTISNENYIKDLAKMPHLLIAGATGQGKSVGINALLVSLLYKKHPSELKFVLVDPKKVELSIYSRIEKHYLAKLPGEKEAIITDTAKVVNTLNSLCIEMDERYDLLKNAQCRNIKEYNAKFKARKLNPDNGHRFLPYIVLIVDEFADLIMTAGKEVEGPIARLAQLARAIGIHLIIATQRPSVNIITGIIKANFPARIAFRVMSKIDSRTILDMGGADQLIGRGDLIYSHGSDAVRLQCPFVDTPEIDEITEFIGEQRSYPSALLLPEYSPDGEGGSLEEGEELDSLFADAARLVVQNDSGSTSMLQRRLKLGYNRAGRIMDQLERAGIVGPQKGSKPREVLFFDDVELEQFLETLLKK